MPLLDVKLVCKSFADPAGESRVVLDNVSLSLEAGESAVISGPSGCGKSTLLNIIAGIIQADQGSVMLSGTNVLALAESARDQFRGQHIGYIFQTHNLLQGFTAADNIRVGGFFSGQDVPAERVCTLLEQVGLADYADYLPHALSLGQQQRVAIARALVHRPALILADEPSSSLDNVQAAACIDLLLELAAEHKTAVLMVSHDERVFDRMQRVLPFVELAKAPEKASEKVSPEEELAVTEDEL